MNRDPRHVTDYLAHILEAIEHINLYTKDRGEAAFLTDLMLQDAVLRNIEIIGEASNNIMKLYPEFVANHPDLPLASAYQMHNAISYDSFKVDIQVVWNTIESDLPELYADIKELMERAELTTTD